MSDSEDDDTSSCSYEMLSFYVHFWDQFEELNTKVQTVQDKIKFRVWNVRKISKNEIERHFSQFGNIRAIRKTTNLCSRELVIEYFSPKFAKKALKSRHLLNTTWNIPILKLSDDILEKIFMQLQPNDVENVTKTCTRFRGIYQAYVERLLTNDNNIDQTKATNLINRYFSAVEEICIKRKPVLRLSLLKDLKCITTLKLMNCELSDSDISLMEQFVKLEILDVSFNKNLTGNHLSNLQNLKQLKLRECGTITDYYFVAIFERHSNLRILDIRGCKNLSKRSLNEIIENCVNLKDISITFESAEHYKSLAFLPKLKKLKVEYKKEHDCRNFLQNFVKTSTLESFELKALYLYNIEGKSLISAIANLTQLKRLDFPLTEFDMDCCHMLCRLENLEYFGCHCSLKYIHTFFLNLLTTCTKLKCINMKAYYNFIEKKDIYKMIDLLSSLPARQSPFVLSVDNSAIDLSILEDPRYLAAKSVFSVVISHREMYTELFVHRPTLKQHYKCNTEPDHPIYKLNPDCIREILSKLPRQDQINFAKVYSHFDEIIEDFYHFDGRWNDLLLEYPTGGHKIKSLNCYGANADLNPLREYLKRVKHIRVSKCESWFELQLFFINVKELMLINCNLKDKDISKIKELEKLEILWVSSNSKLTGQNICELTNLKQLSLLDCPAIESAHFIAVCKSLKGLKFLSIEGCEKLDKSAFQEIDLHCKKLVHLELTQCRDVDYSRIAHLPKLKHLRINNPWSTQIMVDTLFLEQLAESNILESIWVYDLDIRDDFINVITKLPHFKKIEAHYTGNVSNFLRAISPLNQLEKIILGYCSLEMTDFDLLNLFHKCKKLKYIYIHEDWDLRDKFFNDLIDLLVKRQSVWNDPVIIAVSEDGENDENYFAEILSNPNIINAQHNHVMIVVKHDLRGRGAEVRFNHID